MQNISKIVRKRWREAAPAEPHPDADLLTAFAEQSLVESERTRVTEHLARCSVCREVLAFALPSTAAVAVTVSTTPTRTRWLSWPALRWSAVIAAIIAITSVGILHYRQRQKSDSLVSTLTPRNETTVTAERALSRSQAAPESQARLPRTEKEEQAQMRKKAHSTSRTDKLAAERLALPLNLTLPADRAGAASGSVSVAGVVAGSGAGGAPKAATSSPHDNVVVMGGSRSMFLEAPLRLVPRLRARQVAEAPSSSQTVEVESEAAPVTATAGVVGAKVPATAQDASNTQHASPQWSISADGALQRSFDGGNTWVDMDVNSESVSNRSMAATTAENTYTYEERTKRVEAQRSPSPVFRAVSALGTEVWAGGSAAMLYHSVDSGAHWARELPSSSGATLTGDITSIEFSDPQHGRIATSTGEVWITADDGETWRRQ